MLPQRVVLIELWLVRSNQRLWGRSVGRVRRRLRARDAGPRRGSAARRWWRTRRRAGRGGQVLRAVAGVQAFIVMPVSVGSPMCTRMAADESTDECFRLTVRCPRNEPAPPYPVAPALRHYRVSDESSRECSPPRPISVPTPGPVDGTDGDRYGTPGPNSTQIRLTTTSPSPCSPSRSSSWGWRRVASAVRGRPRRLGEAAAVDGGMDRRALMPSGVVRADGNDAAASAQGGSLRCARARARAHRDR